MESYEQIYARMRAAYQEKSGCMPEEVSDLGLRLQVLAGELYRMQAGLDWLRREAFPQTATGERLDLHGAQRGVVRQGSKKARGLLTFSRYVPISFDLVIPQGTVCASYGEKAVEYETTEDAVLLAGQVTVQAPAQAVLGGSGGNAAASYINTLISEVSGIEHVVNPEAFTGGRDPESDEDYSPRVLDAYSRMVQVGNAGWYEERAMEQKGITEAQCVPREEGAGTVSLYVWGEGAAPASETLAALEERLNSLREAGVAVSVKAAKEKKVAVMAHITLKDGAVFSQAKTRVTQALGDWFAGRKTGDPVYLSQLSQVILEADPAIKKLTFNSSMAELPAAAGVKPVLGGAVIGEGT